MKLHIPPALRSKRYFYLWLGLLVSVAGSQMQWAALHWHIRTLTDQPIAHSPRICLTAMGPSQRVEGRGENYRSQCLTGTVTLGLAYNILGHASVGVDFVATK